MTAHIKNVCIAITAIIIQSANFASRPAEPHIDMCSTDTTHEAKPIFRQWAYVILKRLEYQNPQEVKVINAPCLNMPAHACAYWKSKKIYFHEQFYEGTPLGVKLCTIAHEAVHIKQQDDPLKFKDDPQKFERFADQEGVRLGDCSQCGLEIAQYWLTQQDNRDYFEEHSMPKTIEDLQNISQEELADYMEIAHNASKKFYKTHPCGFERGYYLYHISQTSPIKDHSCPFHIAKKEKRLIKPHELLEEIQRQGYSKKKQ